MNRKKAMDYIYLDNPPEPTGRQNRLVLKALRNSRSGITSVEFVSLGVADPRPRIRDLRELGHRVETIQPDLNSVGRYVLLNGGKAAEPSKVAS